MQRLVDAESRGIVRQALDHYTRHGQGLSGNDVLAGLQHYLLGPEPKGEALTEAQAEGLAACGLLDKSGTVPADILVALGLGNQPMRPEEVPHLWPDRGQDGKYVWRRDDLPVYVGRQEDGTLKKGMATY